MRQGTYAEMDPLALAFAKRHGLSLSPELMSPVIELESQLTKRDLPSGEDFRARRLWAAWKRHCRTKGFVV